MKKQQDLISTSVTIGIVLLTIYIVHSFIPSMIWAGIIAISTYPVYERFRNAMGSCVNVSAGLFTFLLSLVLILPLSWLLTLMVQEGQMFVNYLQLINREGGTAPVFLKTLPWVGDAAVLFWDQHIGHPGFFIQSLSALHESLSPMGFYIKQIGFSVAHRSVQIGFTILTLFFFYRDGETLLKYVNEVGHACLNERWSRYFDRLPAALRATVNGTIVVGIGVGCCMGLCYALLGFPTPTLTGFLTAFAAMIPFAVPFVFMIVSLIFLVAGQAVSALIVMLWGTLVMFLADHFVKPVLIGGAIQLPFLAVLFGILGGVETLGLLGLFMGPIILVLFITLCQELKTWSYDE